MRQWSALQRLLGDVLQGQFLGFGRALILLLQIILAVIIHSWYSKNLLGLWQLDRVSDSDFCVGVGGFLSFFDS